MNSVPKRRPFKRQMIAAYKRRSDDMGAIEQFGIDLYFSVVARSRRRLMRPAYSFAFIVTAVAGFIRPIAVVLYGYSIIQDKAGWFSKRRSYVKDSILS